MRVRNRWLLDLLVLIIEQDIFKAFCEVSGLSFNTEPNRTLVALTGSNLTFKWSLNLTPEEKTKEIWAFFGAWGRRQHEIFHYWLKIVRESSGKETIIRPNPSAVARRVVWTGNLSHNYYVSFLLMNVQCTDEGSYGLSLKVRSGLLPRVKTGIFALSIEDQSVKPTAGCVFCPEERLQGVTWDKTSRGKTNLRPCPDGSHGTTTRKCSEEGQWNKANYSDCISVELKKLYDEMKAIMEDRQSQVNAQQALSQLANISQPVKNNSLRPLQIYTRDLTTAVDILVKLAEYNNNTGNVSSKEDFENFAIVASNLLESTNKRTWKALDKAGQGTSQILVKAVDDYGLGVAVTLNGSSKPRTAETRNLAMRIDRVGQNSPVRVEGLKVAYKKSSVTLPPQAFRSSQDFSVVTLLYLTLNAVLSLAKETGDKDDQPLSVNTTIVSSTVSPKPPDVFNRPVEIVLQNKKMSIQSVANKQAKCVFWRPGESAIWNSTGCRFVPGKSNVTMTTCECDHLTIFGALIDPHGSPVSKGLEIISIIGCSVSLISVVITMAVTLFFWRILKTPRTKVLLNLCAAIAITCALVIFEGFARNKAGCPVVAALLHYFLLALFSWMLCEGLLLFINVMKPHQAKSILRSKIQYFYIFGWGFPAIVVAISLAATQANGYGNEDVCWLDTKSGLIWAFIGPALLVILINIVVFVLMICVTVRVKGAGKSDKERLVKVRAGLKASVVVLPLLGVTWLFGLLSFNSDTIAFKYIFTVFNSLQGLMIFIFHCLKDREVKKAVQLWLQKQRKSRDFRNEVRERQKDWRKSRKQNDDRCTTKGT